MVITQVALASLDGPDLGHDHDALGVPEQLRFYFEHSILRKVSIFKTDAPV